MKYSFYSSIWATILMLVMFFISGLFGSEKTTSGRSYNLPSRALAGRTIVVDPGHGGADPGTVGVGKTTEADNVLAIAWELKQLLEQAGARVILTRQGNVNPADGTAYSGLPNSQLAARVAQANRSEADVFVSLHNDWSDDPNAAGSASYYYKSHDWALAEAVQRRLPAQLKANDRGVRHGDFYVLRNTSMPAVLVEIGFLSNAREAELLSQRWYRLEAARGVFYGIVDYFQAMS